MVRVYSLYIIRLISFFLCVVMLSGCPGIGDRTFPGEEAQISIEGDNICFWIPKMKGRQLAYIAINPRWMPYRQRDVIFHPALELVNGKLCIPPSFFHFPQKGQWIIKYVLSSPSKNGIPRKVVTGIELDDGQVHAIPLSRDEIF